MLVGGPGAVQRLDWKNFNQAKPVKKALKRVKSEEGCPGCKHLGGSNAPWFSVQDPRKHKCTALGNSCPTATERCWDQFRDKAKSCLLLWSLYFLIHFDYSHVLKLSQVLPVLQPEFEVDLQGTESVPQGWGLQAVKMASTSRPANGSAKCVDQQYIALWL